MGSITLIVAGLALGQQCATAGYGYGRATYRAQAYYAPTYQAQAYQAPAYNNFVGFVAIDPYYSGVVGSAARAEAQAQVAAQSQIALTTQLGTLAASIADLKSQVAAAQQPPPDPLPQRPYPPQGAPYPPPPAKGLPAPEKGLPSPQSPAPYASAQSPAPYASPQSQGADPGDVDPSTAAPPPPLAGVNAPRSIARPQAAAAYVSVIAAKCGTCHNPQKKSGGLSFFDAPGVLAALGIQDKLDMLASVRAGRMPKTAEKGSPEARQAIAAWIQADAEQLIASLKDNQR